MRLFSVLISSVLFAAVFPIQAESGTASDEAAIRSRMAAYADSRNKRDAHEEALCYTEDGDFRSSQGPFVSGRAAIEKQLTVKDPTYFFNLTVTKLRFLNPVTAIVDAEVDAGVQGRHGLLVADYVVVKQGGDWLISAGRIAAKPTPRPAN